MLYVGCLPVEIEPAEQEVPHYLYGRVWLVSKIPHDVYMCHTDFCTILREQNISLELMTEHNCYPVFLGAELKQRYYRGTSPAVLEVMSCSHGRQDVKNDLLCRVLQTATMAIISLSLATAAQQCWPI